MTKPSHKHTTSLMQSIKLLENALSSAHEPKFRKALQRDIKLHEQVRAMLFHWMENPTLPFLDDREGHCTTPIGKFFTGLGKQLEAKADTLWPKGPPPPSVPAPHYNNIEDEPNGAF